MTRISIQISSWAAALLFLTAASLTSAQTISSTYQATLFNSFDTTGVFGAANSSLDGMTVQLTFTVNTSIGNYSTYSSGDRIEGGTWYSAASPLSVVLTINGHSETILGMTESFNRVVSGNHAFRAIDDYEASTFRHFYQMVTYIDSQSGLLSNSIFSPYAGPLGVNPLLTGSFAFSERYTHIEDVLAHGTDNIVLAHGEFTSGTLVPPVNAIPEPETYAMLLAGLGLLGWHARRRKMKAAS